MSLAGYFFSSLGPLLVEQPGARAQGLQSWPVGRLTLELQYALEWAHDASLYRICKISDDHSVKYPTIVSDGKQHRSSQAWEVKAPSAYLFITCRGATRPRYGSLD